MSISVSPPTKTHYEGVYAAKVYNNRDPSSQGRVQMYIPQIFGATPVPIWAPPLVNSQSLPPVGSAVWCLFRGGDPAYPTYLGLPNEIPDVGLPRGGSTGQQLTKLSNNDYDVAWSSPGPAVRSELGGVSPTSNSGAFVELHTNLRATATIGPSGIAEVMISLQGAYMTVVATDDYSVGTNVDGGGWILCGGHPFTTLNVMMNIYCHHVYTGLTPGPHIFGVGWASTGGGTLNLPGAARGPCQHSANIVLPR